MRSLAGALSALAFAPFTSCRSCGFTVPVFVWLIDGAGCAETGPVTRLLPAAGVGFAFGFGFFLAGLWWIGAAFLVEAAFVWLLPVAVMLAASSRSSGRSVRRSPRLLWVEGWPRIVIFAVAMRPPSGCAGTSSDRLPVERLRLRHRARRRS